MLSAARDSNRATFLDPGQPLFCQPRFRRQRRLRHGGKLKSGNLIGCPSNLLQAHVHARASFPNQQISTTPLQPKLVFSWN
jgi:hypothetical protein